MRLGGKVALITGGGRGIGAGIARAFAAEGARVFLVARTESEVAAVARELSDAAGAAQGLGAADAAGAAHGARPAGYRAADVSDPDAVARAVAECQATLGPVDVLVNAAGVYGPIGPTWDVPIDEWSRAVEVNLMGTLHSCRAVIPGMIERGAGRIINFSGGGATAPLPRFSAYAATKAAVVRLTETLAEELSPHGVAVNAIAPGAIDTTLQDAVLEAGERAGDLHDRMRRLRETGECATPMEVPVGLAVFLASAASDGLTGRLISAPHDGWREWDEDRIAELMARPWLTLRRIDPHTVRPLLGELAET
jgi:NAD(P)-dependent dehydrogenase (short-subunit alcohol dehydrogenase family)